MSKNNKLYHYKTNDGSEITTDLKIGDVIIIKNYGLTYPSYRIMYEAFKIFNEVKLPIHTRELMRSPHLRWRVDGILIDKSNKIFYHLISTKGHHIVYGSQIGEDEYTRAYYGYWEDCYIINHPLSKYFSKKCEKINKNYIVNRVIS